MGRINWKLAFAVIASACWSAFQHGFNSGALNTSQLVINTWMQNSSMNLTNRMPDANKNPEVLALWSVIVSIYCVGGMIGGILTGTIADRFGRKGGLLLNNVPLFVGVICEVAAKAANSNSLLIIGRLVIGINSGLNAGLAPMYVAEISPVATRGSIGTVYQLVITITILLSQVLGSESALGSMDTWPWLFAVCAVPALLQLLMLPLCPESPKYLLLNKGREVDAQRALTWLRGNVTVHGEMEEMHQEAERSKVSKKVTLREMLSNRSLRGPIIIAIVVMISQQFSGINAVISYSTDIFKNAKLSETAAQNATIGMGAMNVVMTLISLFLVEMAGRKTLLLVGFVGMLLDTILLIFALQYTTHEWVGYASIFLVIAFVVAFAIGPGSIPWFLVTELFNQQARPAASSIAVTVNWTANFLVSISFLPIKALIHSYVFAIFAVLQLLFITFIFYKVPETKNKTVEEITAMFRQNL